MKKLLLLALLVVGNLFGREFDLEIQQTINFRTQDIYQDINVYDFDENKYRVEIDIDIADTIYNQEYKEDYVRYLETEKYKGYIAEPIKNAPVILMIRFQFNVLINKEYVTLKETEKVKKKLKILIQNNGWGWNTENIWFSYIDFDSLEKNNNHLNNTSLLSRDDIYDDSWAVIIGIDKYKYSKQLNYAVNDAEAVKEMLIHKFDYPEGNIRYLTDEKATLSEIKLALDDISTTAGENDRVLVFYSGHGETIRGIDGTEKGYIIPYEGRQNKAYATGLAMDEILTTSMMSPSKHMLFLMDACYSGLMTESVKGLEKSQDKGYLSKVANEKARQIITAGGSDEQVIERDVWQHSAFTKNLLEGLENWEADYNNDGCITADELSLYLRENVTEDSEGLQTPQDGRFINSGGGEFVFFGNKNPYESQNEHSKKTVKHKIGFSVPLLLFGDLNVTYEPKIETRNFSFTYSAYIESGIDDIRNSKLQFKIGMRYYKYNNFIEINSSLYRNEKKLFPIIGILFGSGRFYGKYFYELGFGFGLSKYDLDNGYYPKGKIILSVLNKIYLPL